MGEPVQTELKACGAVGGDDPGDIPQRSWIDRLIPAAVRPYLRLARADRPVGVWLLLWPCWWGLALASPSFPDPRLALLFGLGAVIMRAAGCVVNDIADRDFDAKVARTRLRPLASGEVTLREAHILLGLLLLAGLAVLLAFNPTTMVLGLAALPLVFVYPFMKRITHWPQAFLGLTFNWGALMGWSAVAGEVGLPALLLYGAGFFWTLGYDTIYAHQDKEDDLLIGVRSSALWLRDKTRPFLVAVYALAATGIGLAGWAAGLARPFYALLAIAALHLGWQAAAVRLDEPADCLAKVRANVWFGAIVLAAILAGRLMPGNL